MLVGREGTRGGGLVALMLPSTLARARRGPGSANIPLSNIAACAHGSAMTLTGSRAGNLL
jgi:hypothetical protein